MINGKHGLFEDVSENFVLMNEANSQYTRILDENKECLFLSYICEENYEIEEHFHDWIEFTLVLSGEKRIYVEGKENILSSGDFIMIDYNKIHSSLANKKTTQITMQMKRGFIEKYVPEFESYKIDCNSKNIVSSYDNYTYKSIIELFCYLANTFLRNNANIKADFIGYLYLLVYRLMEECQIDKNKDKIFNIDNLYIQNIVSYISSHYNEEISLKMLSDIFYLTPEYISKIIKDELGKGFKEYLVSLRVEHAEILIRKTRKTMLEICEECGFPSNKSFISSFKKKYNKTPMQYRKEYII